MTDQRSEWIHPPVPFEGARVQREREREREREKNERRAEYNGQLVEVERLATDAALHAAPQAHETMSSETVVRYERLAMACSLCEGPTPTVEEDMSDECKDDDLLIQSCEVCIWRACELCRTNPLPTKTRWSVALGPCFWC